MYLSIIIPAYNEEKRIVKTLIDMDSYLRRQSYDYEIIVVNDGSEDRTADVVGELKSRIAHLAVIDNKENQGKGSVVRQGLLRAKGDYRLFTDADNSTPIHQLEEFLPYLSKGYDIIIGSRSIKGSTIINRQPLHRRILGGVYSLLVQLVMGVGPIRDTQCGFKLFSTKSVNDILPMCKINGWSFDVEILVLAKKLRHTIKEIPIVWTNEPQTKVRFSGMARMLFDLLKIRWSLIKIKPRAKNFN